MINKRQESGISNKRNKQSRNIKSKEGEIYDDNNKNKSSYSQTILPNVENKEGIEMKSNRLIEKKRRSKAVMSRKRSKMAELSDRYHLNNRTSSNFKSNMYKEDVLNNYK